MRELFTTLEAALRKNQPVVHYRNPNLNSPERIRIRPSQVLAGFRSFECLGPEYHHDTRTNHQGSLFVGLCAPATIVGAQTPDDLSIRPGASPGASPVSESNVRPAFDLKPFRDGNKLCSLPSTTDRRCPGSE